MENTMELLACNKQILALNKVLLDMLQSRERRSFDRDKMCTKGAQVETVAVCAGFVSCMDWSELELSSLPKST